VRNDRGKAGNSLSEMQCRVTADTSSDNRGGVMFPIKLSYYMPSMKTKEIYVQAVAVPRIGDRVFFIADDTHLSGEVDQVMHSFDDGHEITVWLRDNSMQNDGEV